MSIASTVEAVPADFQSLIAAHRGIILKVAASYSRNADDRADLAREIALQLWRAWPGRHQGGLRASMHRFRDTFRRDTFRRDAAGWSLREAEADLADLADLAHSERSY